MAKTTPKPNPIAEKIQSIVNVNCDIKNKSFKITKGGIAFTVCGSGIAGDRAVANLIAAGLQIKTDDDGAPMVTVKSNGKGRTRCVLTLAGTAPEFGDPPKSEETVEPLEDPDEPNSEEE